MDSTFDNSIVFRRVPKSSAPLGKSTSVQTVKELPLKQRKISQESAYTPHGLSFKGSENIQFLCCTVGHTGTGARQLARTLGERWPLLSYSRGEEGKSARRTKNPLHSLQGSVRPSVLVPFHVSQPAPRALAARAHRRQYYHSHLASDVFRSDTNHPVLA